LTTINQARSKYRRFFRKGIYPNICILENVKFNEGELKTYMDEIGRDLFTSDFQSTLHQFEEADNFGSLILPALTDTSFILQRINEKDISGNVFLFQTHKKILKVMKQADVLSSKYHVVVANPPYMGSKGMNGRLGSFAKDNYPDSKSDLFAMFIERDLDLVKKSGMVAMITMQSWMFLSSFQKFRKKIVDQNTILSMAHLGARAFDSIGGEVVSTTVFILKNEYQPDLKGHFLRIVDGLNETSKKKSMLNAISNAEQDRIFYTSTKDFNKIPGCTIAYWVSHSIFNAFSEGEKLGNLGEIKTGMSTTDNERFVRLWHEVKINSTSLYNGEKWIPYNKGGGFRKWFGNLNCFVNWEDDGDEIKKWVVNNPKDPDTKHWSRRIFNIEYFFKTCVTWGDISTGAISIRHLDSGAINDSVGIGFYPKEKKSRNKVFQFLNSKVSKKFTDILCPTVHFNPGAMSKVPVLGCDFIDFSEELISISKNDWNSFETAWDFKSLLLSDPKYCQPEMQKTYIKLRSHWNNMTLEMQRLEEENNRIFIEAYGLQDELTPDVPLKEITLTCNPHYRYNGNKSEEELEALLLADTMREFISYAVGCMFGRYSLDKPGLILANQGETIKDYLKQIPEPTFPADDDNVIPMLDGDWFTDDISERFKKFLRITFGEDYYEENLKFIEDAIGKDIRKFFLKDFYTDHIRRYKKRPIYWLFSSPKDSFNALIYMHRYRPDTVSVVLNDYLREFRTKLTARKTHLEQISISASASKTEKVRALKEIEKLKKMIDELEAYEREVIYPLAAEQVEIDLDDGVKVNYPKFGTALKKVPGLSAK